MLKHLNKCNNVCGKNVSLTPDFIEKFFLFTNFKTENYEENSCNGFGRCGYFFRKLR
jgi:hypothetical protein